MSDDFLGMAALLDGVVRAVPGVSTLFAADATVARSAKQLTSGTEPLPLVSVAASDDGVQITVSVGVSGEELAPVTASVVAAAVRAALPPGLDADIRVRVGRIA